jgi:hypothetical protein
MPIEHDCLISCIGNIWVLLIKLFVSISYDHCSGLQILTPNVPDIEVIPPEDEHLSHVIDTMAMYVLDDGCAFEQEIMERGRGNPLFNFLFDLGSKEHTYYVWRLYSFAQVRTLAFMCLCQLVRSIKLHFNGILDRCLSISHYERIDLIVNQWAVLRAPKSCLCGRKVVGGHW